MEKNLTLHDYSEDVKINVHFLSKYIFCKIIKFLKLTIEQKCT